MPRRQDPQQELPKNLSRAQFGTMRYISTHSVTLDYLRWAHAGTLSSILMRGYLAREGSGDDAVIILSQSGQAALQEYTHGSIAERKHEAELTERCARLLRLARAVSPMPKAS